MTNYLLFAVILDFKLWSINLIKITISTPDFFSLKFQKVQTNVKVSRKIQVYDDRIKTEDFWKKKVILIWVEGATLRIRVNPFHLPIKTSLMSFFLLFSHVLNLWNPNNLVPHPFTNFFKFFIFSIILFQTTKIRNF